jgi:hypothetical protein
MTNPSQIDTSNINAAFPEAGKDNDTTGFRTNFAQIVGNLDTAKDELTELRDKALVMTPMTGGLPFDDVEFNNLQGNVIQNGVYKQFYGVYGNRGTDDTINIGYGPVQSYSMLASTNFAWAGWTDSATQYSTVRLIFEADVTSSGDLTIDFEGTENIVIVKEKSFPSPLTVNKVDGTKKVVDAWSVDGGATIYVTFIGEY